LDSGPRYSKQRGDVTLEYAGRRVTVHTHAKFELLISLGDMDLEDSFHVILSADMTRLAVGDLLNALFPENDAEPFVAEGRLDIKANPDLPEMYAELHEIFEQWRRGDCTLRFFANRGPEVDLYQPVSDHLSLRRSVERDIASSPVFDLVIEQTHDVLSRFEDWGGARGALLAWLRATTLIYFMDKHGFQLRVDTTDELDRRLLPLAEGLASRELLTLSGEPGVYEVGVAGRAYLGDMIAETESYIGQFDAFHDVAYDLDAGTVDFGTGRGEDLRVRVYEAEGIDPIRAVFLLRLYDSSLDEHSDSWRELIHAEEFFNGLLRPVLDSPMVNAELMESIIESGYAQREEMAEADQERAAQSDTLRRIQES